MTDQLQAFLNAIRKFNPTLEGGVLRFRIPRSMIEGVYHASRVPCGVVRNVKCDERLWTRVLLTDNSEFMFEGNTIVYIRPIPWLLLCTSCKPFEGIEATFRDVEVNLSSPDYVEVTAWVTRHGQ